MPESVSIAQDGTIPSNAQSIQFNALISGTLSVTFAGNARKRGAVIWLLQCGWDGGLGDANMFVDGTVRLFGDSGWSLMATIDAFNGQRVTFQAGYLSWFASNAFGGTNYSNTPVGAVTTVNEPEFTGKPNATTFYGDWAAGKPFGLSAWATQYGTRSRNSIFSSGWRPFCKKINEL